MRVLLSLSSSVNVSKALQRIRAVSSKWVHDTFSAQRHFSWQGGYGAFSVVITQIDDTASYIERQAEQHRKRTHHDECRAFLQEYEIEYAPRFLWD